MYIILIIYIIYIIQIILIIYNVYKLFISLFQRSKISSSTDPPHVCSDLIVTCYLLPLIVKIAPAQGCLVGSEQTCGTTLLLVVSCQLLVVRIAPPRTAMRALVERENVSRWFAIQSQSQAVCTAIAPPSYANRRFQCFTRRDG